MTTPTIKLNSGYEMPVLGIGCYILTPEEAENSVYNALKDGYRLIDTANVYMNERGVGRGMKRAIEEGICTREEIFLTTKLWPSEYEDVESAVEDTLKRLDTEYIDLLLLHQSVGNYIAGYQGMEKAVEAGKVKSIGLSNFYQTKFQKVLDVAKNQAGRSPKRDSPILARQRYERIHGADRDDSRSLVPARRS